MTRRWALAAAFLLTVVCGFLIVSFGSSGGVFAWADRSGASSGVAQATSSADINIGDASIPVADGTAALAAPQRDGAEGGHRDGGEHEIGEHEGGEDRD